jgi:hypothetical protein
MDFPETDFERGENSLRSSSIPRTQNKKMKEKKLPDEAVFLMEFIYITKWSAMDDIDGLLPEAHPRYQPLPASSASNTPGSVLAS